MNHSVYKLVTVAVLASCFANSTSAQQSTTPESLPTHYFLFDDRVDWEIDGRRVLVRSTPTTFAEELPGIAKAMGVSLEYVEETGYPGWNLLWLESPVDNAAAANRLLQQLLQADRIEFASPVFHGAIEDSWVGMTQEVLVQYEQDFVEIGEMLLGEDAPQLRVEERDFAGMDGAYRLSSSARNGFQILVEANRLATDPHTTYAEPNAMFSGRSGTTPNDPGYGNLWGINNTGQFGGVPGVDMDVDVAWNVSLGGFLAPALVLDTGVELTHPDLNIGGGADFSGSTGAGGGPVNQCDNHGTPVAGCISAIFNNALGTVGVAPWSPTYSARCFVSSIPCTGGWTTVTSSTSNALNWGQSQGCRVSNNSNSYGFTAGSIATAYSNTKNAGMVHFASAGNTGGAGIAYPSSLSTVNSIAAITPTGALASFSTFGTGLAFAAPGTSIYSTDRTGSAGYSSFSDYVFVQGTSFASPYTAGVAAILIAWNPTLTSTQVESTLQNSATDLGAAGYDTFFGWGLPNAARAALPPGLALYGSGTSGCNGPQTHAATTSPVIGNPLWSASCNNAPPSSQGWFGLSGVQDINGTLAFGAIFHIGSNPLPPLFPMFSDANGDAFYSTAIPLDVTLIGLTFYSQCFWAWPAATCTPSTPFGLSTSNGMAITIQ